uniref:Uncharacterized protein n=1 Tax=Prymnesium polylepis TaxID=72548 RepID=A0A7S4HDL7_9EUKA
MPAFRELYEDAGSANAPQTHPVLRHLVCHNRSGRSRIPPQFREEVRGMRFFYSTTNLAAHVSRVLDLPCEESVAADPRAMEVAEEVATYHADLLRIRAGLNRKKRAEAGLVRVPFGTTPLVSGSDRFTADMKILSDRPRRC